MMTRVCNFNERKGVILLIKEILHRLGWLKPCKLCEKLLVQDFSQQQYLSRFFGRCKISSSYPDIRFQPVHDGRPLCVVLMRVFDEGRFVGTVGGGGRCGCQVTTCHVACARFTVCCKKSFRNLGDHGVLRIQARIGLWCETRC